MKILVLAPLHVEYQNFKDAMSKTEHKHNYKVVECGVGKANSASVVALEITNSCYDLVVIIGYSAGSSNYSIGELVVPGRARYHDTKIALGIADELMKEYELQGEDSVLLLTGDCFVDKELSERLVAEHGNEVVFDMESTAVAQICEDSGIDVLVLKIISDIPQLSHNENVFKESVEKYNDFTPFLSYLELLDN